jgi:tRNA G10  N-methylase Trm11
MPAMDYLVRFTQTHETFRLAEIEALAVLEGIKLEVLSYSLTVSAVHIPSWIYPAHHLPSHRFAS